MSVFITLHQSLGFDTITKLHPSLADAHTHMRRILIDGGWPEPEATRAAVRGTPVLVSDNGDSETIEVRELTI